MSDSPKKQANPDVFRPFSIVDYPDWQQNPPYRRVNSSWHRHTTYSVVVPINTPDDEAFAKLEAFIRDRP